YLTRKRTDRLPQFLGDEGNDGMCKPEDGFKDPYKCSARSALSGFIAPDKIDLCEFDIPVSKGIPHELVDCSRRKVEAVLIELFPNLFLNMLEVRDYPAVRYGQGRWLQPIEADVLALDIHEHEARRVPKLVAEVAVALAARKIEVERSPESGETGEGEAHRVGAEGTNSLGELPSRSLLDRLALLLEQKPRSLLTHERLEIGAIDQVEGIENVALRLRHLLAFLVTHDGVDVHVAKRHLPREIGRSHDHAHDPEEDDVEAGDQHRARHESIELRGFFRPAERRVTPQR